MNLSETDKLLAPGAWLRFFLAVLGSLFLAALLIGAPYSAWWLASSGDSSMEEAVREQASGKMAIFGSGVSQDFVDYKLRLYEAVKPEIAALGSSRVMQFRADWFRQSFVNMGGAAGNLSVLASTVDAMLAEHRPQAVLLGLDFWWFLPQWEENPAKYNPPTSGSYNYSLASLKKPWEWLLQGKIGAGDFFRPLLGAFGRGFRANRYGIMAQQTDDGFGPDGSWNYTAETTGQKPPFDFQFRDTMRQVALGIKAFYHARKNQPAPSREHLEALADIVNRLRARNMRVFVFIPPLAPQIYEAMQQKGELYPHLFKLADALAAYGIEAMDFSQGLELGDDKHEFDKCEFIDGFHGGEVAYARILRGMAAHWPDLRRFVNMDLLDKIIYEWSGHASVPNPEITSLPETDFMRFGCPKKQEK